MSAATIQYILDANIFIQAKNSYYAFDICPGFWTLIERNCKTGRAVSIDRVLAELAQGHDQLSEWVADASHALFKGTTDTRVIAEYAKLMAWAQSQPQFTQAAKDEFSRAENADAWVVAYAKVNGCIVVTHEKFEPDIRVKVKIPNACAAFGIGYVDTFGMLRELKARFVLSPRRSSS